jgi:hypothetical protein
VYPCWLDYSGKLVYDAKIASGAYCTQNTYDSHPWVILTESGMEYGRERRERGRERGGERGGKLVYDAKIASGAYSTQNTYDSHPWVILTESGME